MQLSTHSSAILAQGYVEQLWFNCWDSGTVCWSIYHSAPSLSCSTQKYVDAKKGNCIWKKNAVPWKVKNVLHRLWAQIIKQHNTRLVLSTVLKTIHLFSCYKENIADQLEQFLWCTKSDTWEWHSKRMCRYLPFISTWTFD